MRHIDFLEINKFSYLHDNTSIFFCKTDFLMEDFYYISRLDHSVTLISGNSDYAITDDIIDIAPNNISAWYAQNAVSNSPILHPMPIGLENKLYSSRPGHGIGYFDRASEREQAILSASCKIPSKFIYSNFNIYTNIYYRKMLRTLSIDLEHIDWQEPVLSISELYNTILDYKMVLCPIGNGIDTHRLWEALYLNRIPITIKAGNCKIYELYRKLPIIILDSMEELEDYQHIHKLYEYTINNDYNQKLLNIKYWIKEIKNKSCK